MRFIVIMFLILKFSNRVWQMVSCLYKRPVPLRFDTQVHSVPASNPCLDARLRRFALQRMSFCSKFCFLSHLASCWSRVQDCMILRLALWLSIPPQRIRLFGKVTGKGIKKPSTKTRNRVPRVKVWNYFQIFIRFFLRKWCLNMRIYAKIVANLLATFNSL